jgi:hypothetical protein
MQALVKYPNYSYYSDGSIGKAEFSIGLLAILTPSILGGGNIGYSVSKPPKIKSMISQYQ